MKEGVAIPPEELFSRDEVLGGLPAKRANTLLFLIESRTAHLVAQSRQAMELFLTETAEKERDLAFIEAFSLGREPPIKPTIHDLERFVPHWASLIPEVPRLRAALAHALSKKYDFAQQAVPNIRRALGLDDERTQQAYRRLYGEPLETIYATRSTLLDGWRWSWTALSHWLESLSPFWTAFALTFTETVGMGILALPIAIASLGPLAGVVLLVVLGVVNLLTAAGVAEACARSGTVRYGNAFFGRLVADFLGNIGSVIVSWGLITLCFLSLMGFYIGFSRTLADATHIPPEAWTALLFVVGIFMLSRKSLSSTIASALLVGAINITLILILALLSLAHVRLENLLYVNVPFLSERSFDVSLLELIFGVIIVSYFGHLSAGNCAKVVLRRDPSARSLIWGIVTAQIFAIVLYCLWVVAVNGALAPDVLAGQSGTPLASLAAVAGPIVLLLGSVFTVLGMGMGSIHLTMGLFNLVGERLPSRSHPILLLMRYRDSLFFERRKKSNDDLHLGMVYLGLQQGKPQFRFDVQFEGKMYRCEAAANENLDAMTVLSQVVPSRISGIDLRLEVLKASEESVSLRVDSSLMIRYEGSWNAGGLHLADALTLPASQRQLLQWMLRQGKVSLPQVVAHLGQDLKTAQIQLDVLMEQGLLREVRDGNEIRYQTHLAAKQGRPLPEHIWRALDKEEKTPARRPEVTKPGANTWRHTVWERMLSERGRFVLSISPVMVAFAMTEWLFFMGAESFSETLSFAGLITASLFSGIFSVLLLVSSRRKGDFIPKMFFQFLGHPVLVISIYILFLVNFFLHGLIIWQNPVQRASALLVGLLALGATIMMIRRGAFAARTVIELRVSSSTADDRAILTSVTGDQQAIVEAALEYPEGKRQVRGAMVDIPSFTKLRSIILPLSNRQARELKVWVHKLTPEGNSESLPAKIEVQCADESKQYDLKLTGEHVQLPLGRDPCQVKIILTQERTP